MENKWINIFSGILFLLAGILHVAGGIVHSEISKMIIGVCFAIIGVLYFFRKNSPTSQ